MSVPTLPCRRSTGHLDPMRCRLQARGNIFIYLVLPSVPLFCHRRRHLLSRAMEGGERDLKKRLETTATQGGGQDLKRNDEAMVVSLEAQPSGAAKERNAKLVRKKLKQEVIDL